MNAQSWSTLCLSALALAGCSREPVEPTLTGTPPGLARAAVPSGGVPSFAVDYDGVRIGESRSRVITLTCVSPVSGFCSAISDYDITGTDARDFDVVGDTCTRIILPNGATCEYTVAFTSRRPVGVKEATLVWFDDQGIAYLQEELVGRATMGVELLLVSVDFGSVRVGTSSNPKAVEIHNVGAEPVTIFGVDDCAPEFAFYNAPIEVVLQPGGAFAYDVIFTPLESGPRRCDVRFSASDESLNEDEASMTITGKGARVKKTK